VQAVARGCAAAGRLRRVRRVETPTALGCALESVTFSGSPASLRVWQICHRRTASVTLFAVSDNLTPEMIDTSRDALEQFATARRVDDGIAFV
jgi:hypothetical protein